MEVSRPRDSTTSSVSGSAFVDWLLAASLALAVVAGLAGIDVRIGGLSISSHSAARVLVASAVFLGIRWRMGITPVSGWLVRIALLTAICGSVVTWFRFLLTTIGGADSYGYVSASQMVASGRLIEAAPIADWLSAANRLALASPLGWAPAADGAGIVPTYPLGVSFVMAAFRWIGGAPAVFFVSPVMALLTLVVVDRLAREWFDAQVALFAVAVVAWNPVFIAYAKQPMSDMAATAWLTLAIYLTLRSEATSGLVAGLAAGAAVITRPVLLFAAAMVPLAAHREGTPLRRALLAGGGLAIAVLIQLVLQTQMYGSPFVTGYGSTGSLFSTSHYVTNVGIFARQGWTTLGLVWMAGLIVGLRITPPALRTHMLAIVVPVMVPYLFWIPFDHWETLRFWLPALVPLSVVVAAGLMHIARLIPKPAVSAALIMAFAIPLIGRSETLLRQSSVWDIAALEARYPLAGEWLNVNTPPNSVALANQHSGSLRWYGKRQTLRWDFMEASQLVPTVRELDSHGASVYVALEGDEVAMFEQRFKDVIDQLQVDHVGSIRNVSFRRLVYLPPNK
jgi:hypothetical protein